MTKTICLHGALGTAAEMLPLCSLLTGLDPQAINLPGHGTSTDGRPFITEMLAAELIDILQQENENEFNLIGYSLGGYIALWLAAQFPEKIARVVTINTKLDWTPEVAAGMARMFDVAKIKAKAPALAAALSDAHTGCHWESVAERTATYLHLLGESPSLSKEQFSALQCPVLLLRGQEDPIVTAIETAQVASWIPEAEYKEIPEGKHQMSQLNQETVATFILQNNTK